MNWKQMFNKKNKIIRIIQKYNVKKYSGKSQASSISGLKELYKKKSERLNSNSSKTTVAALFLTLVTEKG